MAELKITQIRSVAGVRWKQREDLRTLGLRKIRQSVVREDNMARGLIAAVHHVGAVNALVGVGPRTSRAASSAPAKTVEQFSSEVLVNLSELLMNRLGAIEAADIDLQTLGSPREVAEWMAAALPASHPFDESVGPFYDVDGLASRLQTSPQVIEKRAQERELLACPTAEGAMVYPTFQFQPDGSPISGLAGVLDALALGTQDAWQVALWMNTPNEQIDDQRPAEALRNGRTKAVQRLAEQTAARWGR